MDQMKPQPAVSDSNVASPEPQKGSILTRDIKFDPKTVLAVLGFCAAETCKLVEATVTLKSPPWFSNFLVFKQPAKPFEYLISLYSAPGKLKMIHQPPSLPLEH